MDGLMTTVMTKDFAMLQATRRLERYLSLERHNLNKMNDNDRVTTSFMELKVSHFNELVETLNELFGGLTHSNVSLFDRYSLYDTEDMPVTIQLATYTAEPININMVADAVIASAPDETAVTEHLIAPVVASEPESDSNQEESEEEDTEPTWVLEGYASHQAWLADKEAESTEIRDDLTVGLNVGLAQHRAGQVLTEYSESTEQDIDAYMPEDDVPVSVLPQEMQDDEDESEQGDEPVRPTSDLRYLNHTVNNTRLDEDPTQIANVETAVEREGVDGSKGTDIDVLSFSYRPENSMVDNLINDEIERLLIPSTAERVN